MKVMGLNRLTLVAPACRIDGQALAVAAGGEDVLKNVQLVDNLDAALVGTRFVAGTSARYRELGPGQGALREAVPELLAERRGGDVAVVFGPERTGLDNHALTRCNRLWRIPTAGEYQSLNLAAAVQVVAYEIHCATAGRSAPISVRPAARAEDVSALCVHLERVMLGVGFLSPELPGRAARRMRRLAQRSRLEPAEVKLLHGFLNSVEAWAGGPGSQGR